MTRTQQTTIASQTVSTSQFEALRRAAMDSTPVMGLTHRFYRYPARFSPIFAGEAIEQFSAPGDLVLDPYMGGGTTIVEALTRGRRTAGCDINSLAVFIARVKTTRLSKTDRTALIHWGDRVVPSLLYSQKPDGLATVVSTERTRNMGIPTVRPIKKLMALALLTLKDLPSEDAGAFARCVLLNAGQWALNGRMRPARLAEFRDRLSATVAEMLQGLTSFERAIAVHPQVPRPVLLNDSAANICLNERLTTELVDMVVSSPPYPGIHMLYHRWQVDGRRESPAPYWLANCQDGRGPAYYNFAGRGDDASEDYYAESLRTLRGVRKVMRDGAFFVQMIAFGHPETDLPRYLATMRNAGFEDAQPMGYRRILRDVPRRRWHATSKGQLNGSREVVLIHRAA